MSIYPLGVRVNARQILIQLLQIFLVGMTIGSTRVVVPGLAESEFGVTDGSFFALATFVVVFGAVKAVMNLFAGRISDRYGRKKVLAVGWIIALPIPFLFLWSTSWTHIIIATVLLGFNQGLAWSMALNSKLDFAHENQKGLINGLNEFSGYAAVGLAGVLSAMLVGAMGAQVGLFIFTVSVIGLGLTLTIIAVKESLPWAMARINDGNGDAFNGDNPKPFSYWFAQASYKNKALVAINQAGLIEKFTDALVWIFLPVFFVKQGLSLVTAGTLIAIYGVTWGVFQLLTGMLSDLIGRTLLITVGMILCGVGVLAIPFTQSVFGWGLEAFFIGLGMAMLYPNLGAAVGDFSPSIARATLVGIYRFWRDSGYAFGALAMGLLAQTSQNLNLPFMFVGGTMIFSAVWYYLGVRQN